MKSKFSILSAAALSIVLLGAAAPTAQAQFGGIRIGNDDFSIGLRIGKGRHRGHRHSRHCRHIEDRGRYEIVQDRVWHEGRVREVWVPAEWDYRYDDCGRRVRYMIHSGHYTTLRDRGYWHTVDRRVWRPGRSYWSCGR